MKLSEKVTSKIVVVSNDDDWEGLYIDGVEDTQDHKIRRDYLVEICVKHGTVPTYVTAMYDALYDEGRYPSKLDDIPEYQEVENPE